MVSSSGLSCRSSPRISAPICWVSGTTSSRVFVIATIVGIESREDGGRASERRRPTPVGTPAERFLAGLKKEVEVRRRDSVRAVPADGLAPRFGLACRARRRLCSALHATQVAHHGEWEIACASGVFHSVYETAEQVGHA